MDLQPPYWHVILAVLGLFQSALGDLLLNLAVIQMGLATAVVAGPQPAVKHTAVPTIAHEASGSVLGCTYRAKGSRKVSLT